MNKSENKSPTPTNGLANDTNRAVTSPGELCNMGDKCTMTHFYKSDITYNQDDYANSTQANKEKRHESQLYQFLQTNDNIKIILMVK